MRRLTLAIPILLASVTSLLSGCTATSANKALALGATCTQQTVSVNLSATDPTVYHIAGQLCLNPDSRRGGNTVELLVSGLTYDHNYWDLSYERKTYSYVYAANSHGYSTFNIDRLGVGLSDHPPADKVTLQAHAHAIAQIVAQLRTGAIGDIAFQTVVGVGHSMGAAVLQYEAGTATDRRQVPDYLVLADFLYQADPEVVARIGAALYPAEKDPRFVSAGLPSGYLTTRPGTRLGLFFQAGAVDPAVVTADESMKQTSTLAERITLGAARDTVVTHAIRVPILLTVGQNDGLDCNAALGMSCATSTAVLVREAAHYSSQACLNAFIVPDAGHTTNLHRNAHLAYNYTNDWLDRYIVDPSGGEDSKDGGRDANGCRNG
jgi:pimeloyl-ACP methyl ester carboxylesterase